MWGDNDSLRPSKRLHDLLTGVVSPQDSHANILPWAEFMIYQAAEEVLKMPKPDRRAAIDKMPETLRPYLEREIKRLWTLRRA